MKVLVFLLLSLTLGFSTTIYGEIYDGETFENAENAVVRISGPQTIQSVFTGNYSVELQEGEYTIYAYALEEKEVKSAAEEIFVSGNEMNFDLVLLPEDFGKEYGLFIEENEPPEQKADYFWILLAGTFLAGVLIYYLLTRKAKTGSEKKTELDSDSRRVVSILKENEGRMIQKELREILKFSESKMSLIITELEMNGLVKRIKKGRENILKLTGKGEIL